MNKRIFAAVLTLVICTSALGQSNWFKDPGNFAGDVSAMMAVTNSDPSIMAGNAVISLYGSSSEEVKKKLFQISNVMYQKKKYKAIPQFTDFFAAVSAAGSKMSPTDLDSMLYVTQKILEKYEHRQINTYFTTIKNFFEKDALFVSAYNSLYVKGGSYKFRFVEVIDSSPMDRYE